MIALIQRVSEAKVVVDDKNIGEIQQGVLAFIGVEKMIVKLRLLACLIKYYLIEFLQMPKIK